MVSNTQDDNKYIPSAEEKRRTLVYFEKDGVDIPDSTKAEEAFSMLIREGAPAYFNPDMKLNELKSACSEAVYIQEFKDMGVMCEENIQLIDRTGARIDKKLIYRGVDKARGLSIQTRLFKGRSDRQRDYYAEKNIPIIIEDKTSFEYRDILNIELSLVPTIVLNSLFTNNSLNQSIEDVLGPSHLYAVKPLLFSDGSISAYINNPLPERINRASQAFKQMIDLLDENEDTLLSVFYLLDEGLRHGNSIASIRQAGAEQYRGTLSMIEASYHDYLKRAADKIAMLNLAGTGLEEFLVN
jgi:hypothetical protein